MQRTTLINFGMVTTRSSSAMSISPVGGWKTARTSRTRVWTRSRGSIARGIGARPRPAQTRSGSPVALRSRVKVRLIADGLSPSFSAARRYCDREICTRLGDECTRSHARDQGLPESDRSRWPGRGHVLGSRLHHQQHQPPSRGPSRQQGGIQSNSCGATRHAMQGISARWC